VVTATVGHLEPGRISQGGLVVHLAY
jgi:hypothetical protein